MLFHVLTRRSFSHFRRCIVAGADFPRRAHEKGIIPAIASYLHEENELQHMAEAVEIISRIVSDNGMLSRRSPVCASSK
jgi:hypothetical protein